jgi:RND family efflux transporter MFP subunit
MNKSILLLSAVALVMACSGDKKQTIISENPITVQVSNSASGGGLDGVTASGKIESVNSANVSTRMMGYVTQLAVKTGQNVTEGQLLVSVNSTDLQAKKAQVDAAIQQASSAYANAKKDYERFMQLFKQNSASQKELDDMTTRYEMAQAGLESAQQMKNEVSAQFAYAQIKAPFSGVVTNTFVKEGDMANPGMPLVTLEGGSGKQVTAMVSESEITKIQSGMKATVLVKSLQKEFSGKVIEVSLSAKNTGGQYLVKVNLDNPDDTVLSGMFVNVHFAVESPKNIKENASQKVLIPESALVKQGQLTGIYTVGSGNVAILRWLRIGKTYGNQVEVLSGLSADEPYIVSADGKLYNGAKVSVK